MKLTLLILAIFPAIALSQQEGHQKQEYHMPFTVQDNGNAERLSLTLDANWRWTHKVNDYVNCYTGNSWDPQFCPDPASCSKNCAVDGVDQTDLGGTYGIKPQGSDGVSLKLVTQGPYSRNVGSRMYLLDSSGQKYKKLQLLNKEFTFTVKVSDLDCGLNGALYLVEMDADGGMSYSGNNAGAKYGTGYCDAQCPHDIKFINGEANILDWTPSETDPNSGGGKYGTCCAEMDLWEANSRSQAFTTHPCTTTGAFRCDGIDCGDNESDNRFDGVCDKDGCDYASYRLGDRDYYGQGQDFDINTEQEVTVVTQFITDDNTDNGNLVEVRRFYRQNGQDIENSKPEFDLGELAEFDSITDEFCGESKNLFGDYNDHEIKGGLQSMGEAMKRGMVLVLSLWDDHAAHMLWLDSNYPLDADETVPGVARGPCPTDSGEPTDVENEQADATVVFSKIGWGPIGST